MNPAEFAALFPNPAYPARGRAKPDKLASDALGVTYPTWWRWAKAGAFPASRREQVAAVAAAITTADRPTAFDAPPPSGHTGSPAPNLAPPAPAHPPG